MKISSWTKGLRFKMLLLSLIPACFLVAMIAFSYNSLVKLTASLTKANSVRGPLITLSGEMMLYSSSIARFAVTAMWQYDDQTERDMALKKAEENENSFEETVKKYLAMPRSEKAKEIFARAETAWSEVRSPLKGVLQKLRKTDNTKEDLKKIEEQYITEIRPRINLITATIHELNEARRTLMEQELKDDKAMADVVEMFMIVGGILACTVTFTVMFFLLRHVISHLNSVTTSLSEASRVLAASSEELSSSSTEVAASSTENAAAIQQTVASLEELSSMVKNTDENSQASMSLTQETEKQALLSENKLKELSAALAAISESAEKVTSIIRVIDDISFQTNLLALNAAVEAARAGEQGKGFAVVADAVRNLAQKSALSAKEIGELIQESNGKTKDGVDLGQQCQTIISGMFEFIRQVGAKSNQIAQSTREQNIGMEQIAKAMNELDRSTQQNNTASEQISAASNELSSQAIVLSSAIEDLKALVDGGEVRNPSIRAPMKQRPKKTNATEEADAA